LNENFKIIEKYDFDMKYLPIIHDYIENKNIVMILDSPFIFKIKNLLRSKIPIFFDKAKYSKIHILNKKTLEYKLYDMNKSIYIFHYADIKENNDTIEIFASIYEDIDFSNLYIHGYYRKIIINKQTNEVYIESNNEIDNYNLDFPIKYKENIILRNFCIEKRGIDGFVLCNDLDIVKTIFFKDKFISGEPSIVEIDGVSLLIAFAYNQMNGFLIIINLETYEIKEFILPEKVNIGFHSIFIHRNE
jgi:carotenoid cleavage dioxygenase-like enzyme